MEYQLLHQKNEDQKSKIDEEEKEKRALIQPEEDELNFQIEKKQEEAIKNKNIIDNSEKRHRDGQEKIQM